MLASPREIARTLEGKASGRNVYCPGPGHSRQDRSLSVLLDPQAPDGFIVHSFAGDDPLACRDHVRELLGLKNWRGPRSTETRARGRPATHDGPTEAQRIASALDIWRATVPIPGTLAERYLASRGLRLESDLAHVLGFHPRLRYAESSYLPGMVALMCDVRTGEPCGAHRTFLDADGRKVDRRMLGRAAGAAIMIDDDVTGGLHVGEGVETCLAARQLGYRPTWAMGASGFIRDLAVLPGIEALTVLGEADDASEGAARVVCERYAAAGAEAWICQPPAGDLNNTIVGAA